jgi:hypothetical protein
MKAMNAFFRLSAAAGLVALTGSAAFAQQVQLTIKDGRVTLKAENASVRQILDEWTRVGQTRIVNAEKVTGPPLTITLVDVPERDALDTVMRQAAGYAVVERTADVPNASMFDRILVMGRTTPVTQTASAGSGGSSSGSAATYTPPEPAAPADEQIAMADEPPQPAAPVVNPYGGNGGGAPGAVGPNGMANNGANGANGANANGAPGATVGVNPPVKFDYTNPQAYFEQQRRAQQAAAQATGQTGQPGQVNQTQPQFINPYPGSNASPIAVGGGGTAQPQQPSSVPTIGTGTTSAPGVASAPQPAQPPANQGGNFNPYNMSGYQPPANTGQAPPATPVEPDRSKYANPYVPTRTP